MSKEPTITNPETTTPPAQHKDHHWPAKTPLETWITQHAQLEAGSRIVDLRRAGAWVVLPEVTKGVSFAVDSGLHVAPAAKNVEEMFAKISSAILEKSGWITEYRSRTAALVHDHMDGSPEYPETFFRIDGVPLVGRPLRRTLLCIPAEKIQVAGILDHTLLAWASSVPFEHPALLAIRWKLDKQRGFAVIVAAKPGSYSSLVDLL